MLRHGQILDLSPNEFILSSVPQQDRKTTECEQEGNKQKDFSEEEE